MDHIINELCFKGTTLKKDYRRMSITIFLKFPCNIPLYKALLCYIQICVIEGLHCRTWAVHKAAALIEIAKNAAYH